jgi:uncharacterized OsmC-like protein
MLSDEPVSILGEDSAPSAGDYALQSLAACYAATFAANAIDMHIDIRTLHIEVEGEFHLAGFLGLNPEVSPGFTGIRVFVDIASDKATCAQLDDLIERVEERSVIRQTFVRSVPVQTVRRTPKRGTVGDTPQ